MKVKRALSHQETVKALRLFNIGAVVGSISFSLWTGVFITGFALHLGAKSMEIGLLGAIPVLAGVVQPIASFWAEKSKLTRKFFTNIFYLLCILFWLPILAIPFFKAPSYSLFLFFSFYTLANIAISMTNPPYVSWLGDVVPEEIRGRYFSRRNMWAGLAGMSASLAMGEVVDRLPKNIAFPIVFGTAVVFAAVEVFIILLQPEPYKEPHGELSLLSELSLPLKDKNFRLYTFFISFWNFAVIMPGQFFSVFMLKYLNLSYTTIVIVSIAAGIAGFIAQPLFGYLADRYSNKSLLLLTSILASFIPSFYIFMNPRFPSLSLFLLYGVNIIAGAVWAGIMLTQFNLLLGLSPPEKRMSYVGVHSAMVSLTGASSPFIGGIIVSILKDVRFSLWGLDLTGIKILFLISTILRLLSLSLLRLIKEGREEESPLELMKDMMPRRPLETLRAIRLLSSDREEDRLKAIKALGRIRSALGVDGLINLLEDPNPRIRREAIRALGDIGDEKAIEPLLRSLWLEKANARYIKEALRKLGKEINEEEIRSLDISFLESLEKEELLSLLQREEDEEILSYIAFRIAEIGDTSLLPELLGIREKIRSPRFKRQWVYSIGKLIGVNIYPYLNTDRLALFQRIERVLRGIPTWDKGIRRRLLLALRHLGEGNYKKFLERLTKLSDLSKLKEEEKLAINFFLEKEELSMEESALSALILVKSFENPH
ncbi:MAG: MFS transporter [bacterium]